MEIALLGDRFSAQEAKDIGMINFVVPDDQLTEETATLARDWPLAPLMCTVILKPCSIAHWRVNSNHSCRQKLSISRIVPHGLISKKV